MYLAVYKMNTLFFFVFMVYVETTSIKAPVLHDVYWKFYRGELPEDAVEGAPDKYIGNVLHYGRIPATILHRSGVATIALKGKQINFVDHVLIMCSANPNRFYWQNADINEALNEQMKDAVVGGLYNDYLATLYIGKVLYQGDWRIGMVIANDHHLKGLWIWDNDKKEVHIKNFQILKYNSTDARKCP